MKQKILYIGIFIIAAAGVALWSTSRTGAPTAVAAAAPASAPAPAPATAAEQPAPVTGKIEVVEFFWYGCPHCYDLEPYLDEWLASKPDDVEFHRVPAILGENWIHHARVYLTAEKMGVAEKLHRPLFNAIHRDRIPLDNENKFGNFLKTLGIDADEFFRVYATDEIADKVKQAYVAGQEFQLTGVPAIIINGKHHTSPSTAGGNQQLISAMNEIIAQERTGQGGAN